MKYFIRAVKYFFYFTILFVVIMAALVFIGVVKADVSLMFRDGYKSLWQIALLFAFVSAFYPRFGFIKRSVILKVNIPTSVAGLLNIWRCAATASKARMARI